MFNEKLLKRERFNITKRGKFKKVTLKYQPSFDECEILAGIYDISGITANEIIQRAISDFDYAVFTTGDKNLLKIDINKATYNYEKK